MIRILHTSDWHLGKVLFETSLIEDQKYILTQILNHLIQNHYDVMIVAGDIFDRSIPSEEAVQLFNWFLEEFRSQSSAHLMVIPGNHDNAIRLSFGSHLFRSHHIHVLTDPFEVEKPITLIHEGVPYDFYLVPYLEPLIYSSPDQVHTEDCMEENPREDLGKHEYAFRQALRHIRSSSHWNPLAVHILVAHVFSREGQECESERKIVGTLGGVPPELFEGFDLVALGHLHRAQKITEHVYYSGSPLKYSFSEIHHPKQMLSIQLPRKSPNSSGQTDQSSPQVLSLPEVSPVYLSPLRDMVRLQGSLKEALERQDWEKYRDCFLEFILQEDTLIPHASTLLKGRFPHLLQMKQAYESWPNQQAASPNHYRPTAFPQQEKDPAPLFEEFHHFLMGEAPSPQASELFKEIFQELSDEVKYS